MLGQLSDGILLTNVIACRAVALDQYGDPEARMMEEGEHHGLHDGVFS